MNTNIVAKTPANRKTMSAAQIETAIKSIRKNGLALRKECHETAVAVAQHYIDHGDLNFIPKLHSAIQDSLGQSVSAAFNVWLEKAVVTLKWDKETKTFIKDKSLKDEAGNKVKPAFAMLENVKMRSTGPDGKTPLYFTGIASELPFYELERPVNQEPFNFKVAVMRLIKTAEGKLEKNILEGANNIVTRAQIDVLKSIDFSKVRDDEARGDTSGDVHDVDLNKGEDNHDGPTIDGEVVQETDGDKTGNGSAEGEELDNEGGNDVDDGAESPEVLTETTGSAADSSAAPEQIGADMEGDAGKGSKGNVAA